MTLDDVDPRIFGFFVHWLYTQELCPKGEAFILMDLTRFYRLADRFMVHPLQNDLRLRITCFVPSQDPGNTLKDFQLLAYSIDGDNWLKEPSFKLVREAMMSESESPDNLIDDMTPEMVADYAKAISGDLIRSMKLLKPW